MARLRLNLLWECFPWSMFGRFTQTYLSRLSI